MDGPFLAWLAVGLVVAMMAPFTYWVARGASRSGQKDGWGDWWLLVFLFT